MEKRHYRLRENIPWYFKIAWQGYPQFFLWCGLGIFVKATQALLTVALPTVLVSLLVGKAAAVNVVVIVTGIGIALAVTNLCKQLIDSQVALISMAIRIIFQSKVLEKSLKMDYQLMENPVVREIKHIAEVEGVNQNSAGAEAFAKHSYFLIETLVSFLLFGVTLSLFNPLLFVLIILTALTSFYSLRRTRLFREKHKSDWGKLDAKSHYLKTNAYAIENGKDIRLYAMTNWYDQHIEDTNKERHSWSKKESSTIFTGEFIQETAVWARNLVAYMLLISAVIKGKVSLTQFTLFFTVLNNVTSYVNELAEYSHLLLKANQDINDLRHFLEIKDQTLRLQDDSDTFDDLIEAEALCFSFEDVYYKYAGAEEYIVKKLSFTLKKGENVALVGNNGAGKSTIVKLLTGLIQPTKGRILVNDVDISSIPLDSYYELIAPVFQESLVFAFDLATNVTLTDDSDSTELMTSIEQAGLAEKVASLPEGIYTQMKQYLRSEAWSCRAVKRKN